MLPLEGIKVLDLTRLGPGPYCTMMLADWGADVLRVEQPGGGKRAEAERKGKSTSAVEERRRIVLDAMNRNKKSIAINLKEPEAVAVFLKLARKSDVVVESFRPGVTSKLNIGYASLKEHNPGIIYCSISGYGQTGPYSDLVGHDINYVALAGLLSLTGEHSGRPRMPSNIVGDFAAGGQQAVIAILLALMARSTTGEGRYLDISMTDGIISLLTDEVSRYFITGRVPLRGETQYTGSVPYYEVYETADAKYISVGCNEPHFFANLCRALELEEFLHCQYAEGAKRREMFAAFSRKFKTRSRQDWFEFLKKKEICVAPVYDIAETLNDPHVIARGLVREMSDPVLGAVRQIGSPLRLSGLSFRTPACGPARGQNTREVLSELGYDSKEVDALLERQVVEEPASSAGS